MRVKVNGEGKRWIDELLRVYLIALRRKDDVLVTAIGTLFYHTEDCEEGSST